MNWEDYLHMNNQRLILFNLLIIVINTKPLF